MSLRQLQRTIFAGCRDLGLDADMRRDLQRAVTGKDSLGQMNETDMRLVLKALQVRGFKPKSKGRPKAPRQDLAYIHVLWRLLREAGELERPNRDGLNAFIRARFGNAWQAVPADIDMLREPAQIEAVIRALTSWCRRAGIDP